MIAFDSKNERLLLQALLKASENEDFSYELRADREHNGFQRTYRLRIMGYGREFNLLARANTSSFEIECDEIRNIVGLEGVKDPISFLAKAIKSTLQRNFENTKEALENFLGKEE